MPDLETLLKQKRLVAPDRRKIRNLTQYRNLSDDEFDELMAKKELDVEPSADFERRIQIKLKDFEKDYDLTDLKINDMEALRALIQAIISLEDYEQTVFKLRQGGVNMENLVLMEKVNKFMSDLRSDISKLQSDLNISRKTRQSDKESSVINFIDGLKDKAKKFMEAKQMYIFCPNCGNLVATTWSQNPEEINNISLKCVRRLDGVDGPKCNTRFEVCTRDMLKTRGTNRPEIFPESM